MEEEFRTMREGNATAAAAAAAAAAQQELQRTQQELERHAQLKEDLEKMVVGQLDTLQSTLHDRLYKTLHQELVQNQPAIREQVTQYLSNNPHVLQDVTKQEVHQVINTALVPETQARTSFYQ